MKENEKRNDMSPEVVQLNGDQKIQVLLAQMNERCQAWHHMRDRSMQFTIWILGLEIAASWKLLQGTGDGPAYKIVVTALAVILGIAAFHFLKSIDAGARSNRKTLVKIETALGLHSIGSFSANASLLPSHYKDTKLNVNAHFVTLYILLLTATLFLLGIIWIPTQINSG